MSQQNIDIGSAPSSGDGDPLRTAFIKINQNFTELYSNIGNLTNSVTSVAGRTGNVSLTVNDIIGFSNYQYANIAYVDNAINNLISSAPETLDTLNELAAALNNDENFASNVINTINQIVDSKEEFEYISVTGRIGFADEAVTFVKPAYTDIGDEIDANLTLTRAYGEFINDEWVGGGGAIYNSELEDSYNELTSPAGTLWNLDGWTNLDNVQTRYYSTFKSALRNQVGANVIGAELVMWDTINNKYYTVQFTNWAVGPSVSGAFTYTRRLIDTDSPVGITFADGTNIVTAPREYWDEPQTFVGGTNTYVLRLEDRGHHIYAGGASIQVPSNLQLEFPIGSTIRIIANGSAVTVIPCECVTPAVVYRNGFEDPSSSWTISAYSSSTLTKVAENTWRLTSDDALVGSSDPVGSQTELPYLDLTNKTFGEAVEFNNTGADGGVDEISEGLHITRGEYGWLYNPLEEEESGENTPTNSLWNNDGWNDLTDIEDREYVSLATIWQYNFRNIVGAEMVMLDTTTDKYYAVKITRWSRDGEGFGYVRYEIDLTQLQEGIKFADGTVQKTAYIATNVKLTAEGDRRIEEVAGYKSVSVTSRTVDQEFTGVTLSPTLGPAWDVFIDGTVYTELYAYVVEFSYQPLTLLINGVEYSVEPYISGNNIILYASDQNGGIPVNYSEGDAFTVTKFVGGEPEVWWDKRELPGGSSNFRGAVIDYHAYTGDGTIIGTIHIVDDSGEEHITHTEVSSGNSSSLEANDLWVVDNEGTISYRRLDYQERTLRIQWTAKVFYGSEYYD